MRDIAQEYKLDQQDQASPVNVSTDERLLNVADDLFGESVAQAEPSVCEIVNDEVASELVCALPLKHAVNDIQIQLNTLKHAFERYRSEASIVLTDLISNQELLSGTAGNNRIDEVKQLRFENNIWKDENKVLNERLKVLQDENAKTPK